MAKDEQYSTSPCWLQALATDGRFLGIAEDAQYLAGVIHGKLKQLVAS